MALWKKGKKVKDAQDAAQKVGSEGITSSLGCSFIGDTSVAVAEETSPFGVSTISPSDSFFFLFHIAIIKLPIL